MIRLKLSQKIDKNLMKNQTLSEFKNINAVIHVYVDLFNN